MPLQIYQDINNMILATLLMGIERNVFSANIIRIISNSFQHPSQKGLLEKFG